MKLSNKFWYNVKTHERRKKKPSDTRNWEHWDSNQEFEFYYRILLPITNQYQGVFVKRQSKFPESQAFDSLFPRHKYICDFELYSPKFEESIWIEYKGDWVLHTPTAFAGWLHRLRFLEARNHYLMRYNFVIIGNKRLCDKLPDFPHAYPPSSTELKKYLHHLCIAATAIKS